MIRTTKPLFTSSQSKRRLHLSHLCDSLRQAAYHASLTAYESDTVAERARLAGMVCEIDAHLRALLARQNQDGWCPCALPSRQVRKARGPRD